MRRVIALAFAGGLATVLLLSPSARAETVRVHGIEMYYEVRGEGEPLVLLHGFHGCGGDWGAHAEALSAHYRLIIPDQRGHGRSTGTDGEFTHRQAARDLLALLDALGIERFRAMGISSGGVTLLHVATSEPERLERLVLIGGTSYLGDEARGIMRAVEKDGFPPGYHDHFLRCASRGEAQLEALKGWFTGFQESYDDVNFTAPFLGTIQAPTLLVHGDRDEFFPVRIATGMYEAIPHAFLWVVPNGSHVPIFGPLADEFQERVLAFLGDDWKRPN